MKTSTEKHLVEQLYLSTFLSLILVIEIIIENYKITLLTLIQSL